MAWSISYAPGIGQNPKPGIAAGSASVAGAIAALLTNTILAPGPYALTTGEQAPTITRSSTGAATPVILMTNAPSGPMGGAGTSGDENGLGGYLCIYGYNFGTQSALGTTTKVFIGGIEVANYRCLVPMKVATAGMPVSVALQEIIVQLGALGSRVNGTAYPVVVQVAGVNSNTNLTFTPNPGTIRWIDTVHGSDSGSHVGITQPWKTPQFTSGGKPSGGLMFGTNIAPGDQAIFRAGTYSTTGQDNMCFRYFQLLPAPVDQSSGVGHVAHMPYPGPIGGNAQEVVTFFRPSGAASAVGGNDSQRGSDTNSAGGVGWAWGVCICDFVFNEDPGAVDGPVNNGSNSNRWFICNNEMGPWLANVNGKAAGIAGDGQFVTCFGNYIHDINSPTHENHGIYLDASANPGGTVGWAGSNWDVWLNYIKNMLGGSGLQMYGGGANGLPSFFKGNKFHHNVIDTAAKYGCNFADNTQDSVCYNNLFLNLGSYAFRTNSLNITGVSFINNTCYNVNTGSAGGSFFNNEWNLSNAGSYVEIRNNIFIMGAARSNNSLAFIADGGSDTVGAIQASTNLGYDPQGHTTTFSGNLYGDPKVSAQWTDFRLQAGSPAINAGSVSPHLSIANDLNFATRPKPGNANPTIGCYEAP